MTTLISVLNVCDNFRPHLSPEPLVPFLLTPNSSPPLGLLRPPVVAALHADNAWRSANGHPLAWDIPTTTIDALSPPYIAFAPVLASGSPAARTQALAETLERWRADANRGDGDGAGAGAGAGAFAEVIGGSRWRSEWYDVYLAPCGALRTDGRDPLTLVDVPITYDPASGPVSSSVSVSVSGSLSLSVPESGSESSDCVYVFSMERSACALFGVVTHGVHMTVYEQKGDADGESPVRVWVPRRAATKPTYPGMLDNSVAGGIPGGMTAFDTLVKEAAEEASLDPQLVRKKARSVGAVSYYRQTDAGWLQPEVQFVYDMRVEPGEARLAPMDGEVESFELMSIDEIVSRMHAGEFKPNCALVLIDFLVRHGYLTPENEPRYLEITQRFHGKFDIERW